MGVRCGTCYKKSQDKFKAYFEKKKVALGQASYRMMMIIFPKHPWWILLLLMVCLDWCKICAIDSVYMKGGSSSW